MERLRFYLMLVLLVNCLLAAGQIEKQMNFSTSVNPVDDRLQLAIEQMAIGTSNEDEKSWCYLKDRPKHLLEIRHQPSIDFNIYLTYRKKVASFAEAAIEVSLNNSGVVNLRSLIALRKKSGELDR